MPQTKKKPAAKPPAKPKPTEVRKPLIRREVWAGIAFFFSFIGLLSFASVKGFFIRGYDYVVATMIGTGIDLLPFALAGAGALLIIKRKGKARLRVTSVMLLPLLYGAFRHLFQEVAFSFGLEGFKTLAESGRQMASGGLLSGSVSMLFSAAISPVGAGVLFCILMAVCLFLTFNLSPKTVMDKIRALRPSPEPEEEDEPVKAMPAAVPAPKKRKKIIDIELDEDDDISIRTPDRNKENAVAPPNVPTPAEALRATTAEPEPTAAFDPTEPAMPRFTVTEAELEDDFEDELPFGYPVGGVKLAEYHSGDDSSMIDIPIEEFHSEEETEAPAEEEEDLTVEQQIEQALSGAGVSPVYLYPPITLLKPGSGPPAGLEGVTQSRALRLLEILQSFSVEAQVVDITVGPAVTRYELQLQRGIKMAKVTNLADDIALALGVSGVRFSTIPNKNAVGIEAPNEQQELVTARDIIGSTQFTGSASRLTFAVGKDIAGECVVGDIGKMPHMLIAGTTGSGKSVCINSILISLLYKATPEEVRLIMIDPKMIELGVYNGIPHLLVPVVTDPKKAAGALNWAVGEMLRRYKLIAEVGARDLAAYNKEIRSRGEGETMPQIVIVVDELSDLMVAAKSEVEEAIIRLAQMARAAGMHLIIATQRPSADVITGLMKTNIPSRIAFAVSSQIDSRIILDQMGAEKLLGKGDMLYAPIGSNKPMRIQGCFVTDREVEEVVAFVKKSGQPDYSEEVMTHIEHQAAAQESQGGGSDELEEEDELLSAAIEIVVEGGQASVSMLQRRLKLGYSRAARLVDQMEERGIVGPFEGSKPRAVLISRDEWKEMVLRRSK